MALSDETKAGLGVALNEADWLGISVNPETRQVALGLRVFALPHDATHTERPVVTLLLSGVARVAASLRAGRWDDVDAAVHPLQLEDLAGAVEGFGGLPIYGWEFLDPPEHEWQHWRDRLSLDVQISQEPTAHVIDLFQEGGPGPHRHLDLRVWFNSLAIFDQEQKPVPIDEFIDAGVRWWDGLHAGDPRAAGHGIVALDPEGPAGDSSVEATGD